MSQYKNKNILITGCSKGLGFHIASKLLEEGANVFGIYRNDTLQLINKAKEYPNNLFLKKFDLFNSSDVKIEIFDKWILNKRIPIHGFVNNAAYAYDDIVSNANLEEIEKMYKANVFSPMILTKYIIRNFLLNKISGNIIHVSSISVHTGYKGLSMYASTKGALEAFSKNVAREWGSKGIKSNCLVAGFMETDMSQSLTEEQKNKIYRRTALGIPTSIDSAASTIIFLMSDSNSSITGQNIFVDSGTI